MSSLRLDWTFRQQDFETSGRFCIMKPNVASRVSSWIDYYPKDLILGLDACQNQMSFSDF